jgi:peptidoglycan/LPS O-acetylase OafA/YrhL
MYYKKIDGLRCIAITCVLVTHFLYPVELLFHLAYYGVDLFFCISGFLITGILLQHSNSKATALYNFFGRRVLRIFPVYYLTISILYLLHFESVYTYPFYFFSYTYNYAEAIYRIPVNACTHIWSLCVEEQFYIIWPIVVIGLAVVFNYFKIAHYYLKTVFLTICLFAAAAILQRYFFIFSSQQPFNIHGLITNMFALCIGSLGALLHKKIDLSANKFLGNIYFEYIVISCLIFVLYTNSDIKYLICPFISLFFVLKAANELFSKAIGSFLCHSKVVWIGTISYGLYVYHWPANFYFRTYIFDPIWSSIPFENFGKLSILQWHSWIFKFPCSLFISFFVAALSYKYLEKPLLKYKDIFFK